MAAIAIDGPRYFFAMVIEGFPSCAWDRIRLDDSRLPITFRKPNTRKKILVNNYE